MEPSVSSRRRISNQHVLIYELYRHGETVFDGIGNFRAWLERSNAALSGKRPLDLLTSARGFKEVDDLLTRIEFGVY
ncbi:MAG: MbcA/ParS/Xre antitoxin family protein [Rudanella sp.]|nr:MbcA/ParS/Xre antitoxin family protein [Rudanella sp.]